MKFIAGVHHIQERARIYAEFPEIYKVERVEGGHMTFDTREEYETWKKQQ